MISCSNTSPTRRVGRFLSGGTVRLPLQLGSSNPSRRYSEPPVCEALVASRRGLGWNKKMLTIWSGQHVGMLLGDRLTTTRATFNGCNTSAWKTDIVRRSMASTNGWNGEAKIASAASDS